MRDTCRAEHLPPANCWLLLISFEQTFDTRNSPLALLPPDLIAPWRGFSCADQLVWDAGGGPSHTSWWCQAWCLPRSPGARHWHHNLCLLFSLILIAFTFLASLFSAPISRPVCQNLFVPFSHRLKIFKNALFQLFIFKKKDCSDVNFSYEKPCKKFW